MSASDPFLSGTIEADEEIAPVIPTGNIGKAPKAGREPVVLVPGTQANGSVNSSIEDGGIVSQLGGTMTGY
jgi:hypothetical protein